MAERKKKDTEDKNVLNTSPEEEGQGDQALDPGTPPQGGRQDNSDPAPGASSDGEGQNNQNPTPDKKQDAEDTVTYEITCRNKINKPIGGVKFVDGVGHTEDGYAASWFRNKEGYEVTKIKQ